MMKIFKYLDGNKTMRTAPKAEVRYANSRVVPGARYAGAPADKVQLNVLTNIMGGGMLPAHILRYIPINGDTTYVELPEALSYMFKPTARYERSASFKNPKGEEYNILKRRFNTAWGIAKHQDGTTKGGIQFKENLTPPSRGFFESMGNNIEQGSEIFNNMMGSLPMLALLGGVGAGFTGMVGPTVRILKDAKYALGSRRGFANTARKVARNLNAKKGDPSYRWTKTSGNIRSGGPTDYMYQGMSPRTLSRIWRTARSEGSGYNALSTLNTNPTYLRASAPGQTGFLRVGNNSRSVPVEQQASRRVMQRNRLIDRTRDWRNWIFE